MAPRTRAIAILVARLGCGCTMAASLAACASTAAGDADGVAAGTCDASKVQWAIGMAGDQATMGRIWRESGAGLFRPLIKGQAPLQDHKPDRVNIHLDEANRIVAIDCG
jgi:hypothetical protein